MTKKNSGLDLITKTASCPAFGGWAIKHKLTKKFSEAKPGDIILFDFNHNGTSDHIGIIYKVNKDGSVQCIEGNTSLSSNDNGGNVMKRTRYKSQCNYLVRPKYTDDITAEMVIATALTEVGTKESPAGSNKQKYGAWIGANGVPWCAAFVCWCFAHTYGVPTTKKPTTKYEGKLNKLNIKQGAKSNSVKYWQKFLNWYMGKDVLTVDGDFGKNTTEYSMIFQKTEGLKVDGVVGKYTRTKAYTYLAKKKDEPTTGDKLADMAEELAWGYGTSSKTTSYKTGRPTNQFKAALHKFYPNYKNWGRPPRLGASCDVGVGTVVRATGYDAKFPRGGGFGYDGKADEQWGHLEKSALWKRVNPKSYKDLKRGDIVIVCKSKKKHTGHIWMALGGEKMAEAGYARIYFSLYHKAKSRFGMSGTRRVYRAAR